VRAQGDDVFALIGARRRDQLGEAQGALQAKLSKADLARIEQAAPHDSVAGERYLPAVMAHLDSEQK
jgi:aryl-alcohol dehydrogenase-like predicted oxidoreductase